MSILRAGALSAVGTAARLAFGLVIIKLVAWFGGPEAVGKLGQFMSLMAVLAVLSGGGIGTAIVKYVAEYKADRGRLARLLGSAAYYSAVTSAIALCLTLLFSETLAVWLLDDERYRWLIWVLALSQPLLAANNYIIAVINGYMDVRRVAIIHVVGSAIIIVLALALAWRFKLDGTLIALTLGQVAMLAVAVPILLNSPYFDVQLFKPRFDRQMTVKLASFSLMTITSAMLPPLVSIWVRNHLAGEFSWEEVGYWQAVSKVSEAYLLFFAMTFSVYYLPKLSGIVDRNAFKAELRAAYVHVMPVVIGLALALFVCREWVTLLLFSDRFVAAEPLFAPQLVGDVIKIASFMLSYVMLAKAMTRLYLISEFAFSISYIALVYLLTWQYGLIGAMYAFAINYTLYLTFTAFVVRDYVRGMPEAVEGVADYSIRPDITR